ncbi:hypothetical protein ABIC10_006407 [Bradyrhizobium sp. S3.2.12]
MGVKIRRLFTVCSLARHLYISEQEAVTESDVAEIAAAEKVTYKPKRFSSPSLFVE